MAVKLPHYLFSILHSTYVRHDMDFLVDEGVIAQEDRELFWFAETAQEIWDGILHWYDKSGMPLSAAVRARVAPSHQRES